jgi:NAD(P)-dependent dehydrogenase (short-subunit alcohol dehydrogenase family)
MVENFNTSWSTNVLGAMLTTNAFLPLLRKGKTKKVMALSTGLGDPALNLESGFAAQTAYIA